ncbi:MAG: polyprenyl synthetase family protein [bacterium]
MDVHAYIAERVPLIDAGLEARLAPKPDVPEALGAAMRHLLFPGGKRLRPLFALAAAEAVGGAPRAALPIALSVELIHTYSLIHDDLPCMDDDVERRGRPTVHVAFDEATAVLAGDALLTEAFAVLSEAGTAAGIEEEEKRAEGTSGQSRPERILFGLARLSRAAGASGLVGGQVDDLRFSEASEGVAASRSEPRSEPGPEQRPDQLTSIHERKTAALFQAALVGGAALGGADAGQREVLEQVGRDLGVAFQIADDLLDAESEEGTSILRLSGAGEAAEAAERLLQRALARLEGWGERTEPLRELARHAVRRNR